jgi:general secretion pathway protein G
MKLQANSRRGFTLLELVVVIVIISILVVVALNRLLPFVDEAERVSVLQLEGQLRSTLMMEAAERIVRGQSVTITELNGTNPVNFLADPPKNYVGELKAAERATAPPRHWYFDDSEKRLVYRLGDPFALNASRDGMQDPAFAVRVAYADRDGNGHFDASQDELIGVRLERVSGAEWLAGMASN